MTALHPDLDFGRPLEALREAGAAFIPHALSDQFRQQLQRDIEDGPFEPLPDRIGPVRQEVDLFVVTDAMTDHLKIDGFGWALVGALVISVVSWLLNVLLPD